MKILICEDHEMVREAFTKLLKIKLKKATIFEARDGSEAIRMLQNESVDLVLLDVQLPVKSGIEVFVEIKEKWPHIPVLMMSGFANDDKLTIMYEKGVAGYISKNTGSKELILAITTIMEGKRYFDTSIIEAVLKKNSTNELMEIYNSLPPIKKEIAMLLAKGYSQLEISEMRNIAKSTVGAHKSVIMSDFNFTEDAQLTLFFIQNKLFDPNEIDLLKPKFITKK